MKSFALTLVSFVEKITQGHCTCYFWLHNYRSQARLYREALNQWADYHTKRLQKKMYNVKHCVAWVFKALSLETRMELHIHMSACHSVKFADVDWKVKRWWFRAHVCPKLQDLLSMLNWACKTWCGTSCYCNYTEQGTGADQHVVTTSENCFGAQNFQVN